MQSQSVEVEKKENFDQKIHERYTRLMKTHQQPYTSDWGVTIEHRDTIDHSCTSVQIQWKLSAFHGDNGKIIEKIELNIGHAIRCDVRAQFSEIKI